jgi:hypothetical protein
MGEVSAARTVLDPVLGEKVAFYSVELQRVGVPGPLLARSGGAELVIIDASGPSWIDLDAAELMIPVRTHRADGTPSALMQRVLNDAGVTVPEFERGARYELHHRAIRIGEVLTVIGVASAGRRFDASASRLCVSQAPLLATQERERVAIRGLNWMLGGAIAIVVVAAAIAALLA